MCTIKKENDKEEGTDKWEKDGGELYYKAKKEGYIQATVLT